MHRGKILVIDDDSSIRRVLQKHLTEKGFEVNTAGDGEKGLEIFQSGKPDIVILDIRLPGRSGLQVLEDIKSENRNIAVVMITAHEDMETTIDAMHKGAFDYLPKPLDIDIVDSLLERIFTSREMEEKAQALYGEDHPRTVEGKLVGKSSGMKRIWKLIGAVSATKATVLIQGESGTGKELVARAIHENSNEKDQQFLAVNCTALVETLLESELFGHERGAFTGAVYEKKGVFEIAGRGTIFLDEIGDMSPGLQAKLLRVLQEREFTRVGGTKIFKTHARIIAATNRNLSELVEENRFRRDLYYRLRVVEIHVPPLRDRKEDIPILVTHLLERINAELGKNVRKVSDEVMGALMRYQWTGNVRELENVLRHAVVVARGAAIMIEDLPELTHEKVKETAIDLRPLREVEAEHIERTLNHARWNKSLASRLLGITRPTLDKKIKEFGLGKKQERRHGT
ncbi:MAG: sigma-54-dependent transcriptional regulator [Candidatus Glassbacteria bacterium]